MPHEVAEVMLDVGAHPPSHQLLPEAPHRPSLELNPSAFASHRALWHRLRGGLRAQPRVLASQEVSHLLSLPKDTFFRD